MDRVVTEHALATPGLRVFDCLSENVKGIAAHTAAPRAEHLRLLDFAVLSSSQGENFSGDENNSSSCIKMNNIEDEELAHVNNMHDTSYGDEEGEEDLLSPDGGGSSFSGGVALNLISPGAAETAASRTKSNFQQKLRRGVAWETGLERPNLKPFPQRRDYFAEGWDEAELPPPLVPAHPLFSTLMVPPAKPYFH